MSECKRSRIKFTLNRIHLQGKPSDSNQGRGNHYPKVLELAQIRMDKEGSNHEGWENKYTGVMI